MNIERKVARMESILSVRWPVGLRRAGLADVSKPVLTTKGPNAATLSADISFRLLDLDSMKASLASAVRLVLEELREIKKNIAFKFKKLWVVPQEGKLSLFALLDLSDKAIDTEAKTETMIQRPGRPPMHKPPSWHSGNSPKHGAVAAELLRVARLLVGMEFDTQEALDAYLKEHPDADKSNHWVKKDGGKASWRSSPASQFSPEQHHSTVGKVGLRFNPESKRLTMTVGGKAFMLSPNSLDEAKGMVEKMSDDLGKVKTMNQLLKVVDKHFPN
jgi:hypothetical protein